MLAERLVCKNMQQYTSCGIIVRELHIFVSNIFPFGLDWIHYNEVCLGLCKKGKQ